MHKYLRSGAAAYSHRPSRTLALSADMFGQRPGIAVLGLHSAVISQYPYVTPTPRAAFASAPHSACCNHYILVRIHIPTNRTGKGPYIYFAHFYTPHNWRNHTNDCASLDLPNFPGAFRYMVYDFFPNSDATNIHIHILTDLLYGRYLLLTIFYELPKRSFTWLFQVRKDKSWFGGINLDDYVFNIKIFHDITSCILIKISN